MSAPAVEDLTGGLPRNYLRACLLLLLAEEPSHGYELLEQVRELGLENADPGGLYRALRAMEQEDLLDSWWEHSEAGPARRTYTLTHEGNDWLHAWGSVLRVAHRSLGRFLERYDGVVRATTPAASEPAGGSQ